MPDKEIIVSEDGTLTVADAAAVLSVTPAAVRKWVTNGAPSASEGRRGAGGSMRVRMKDLMDWHVDRARRTAPAGGGAGDVDNYESARARKTSYQADLAEIEARKAAGEIVEVRDVAHLVEREYGELRAALLNLPSRLSVKLSAETDAQAISDFIGEEVADVLGRLSNGDVIVEAAVTGASTIPDLEEEIE